MIWPRKRAATKLTRDEVLRWAKQARARHEELDLRSYDLRGLDLSKVELKDVVFGRHERDGAAPAKLESASFRESSLEHCFFSHANLTNADFRGSNLSKCDFRYADFHRTTLEEATLKLCDLYRATIRQGTVMLNTTFELVSLTASLEGSTDLRFDAFKRRGGPPGLVTEDERAYRRFLKWTQEDRRESYPIDDAVKKRLVDAARTYRNLSAHWAARGQFHDAGCAYVHSRRLERRNAAPWGKHRKLPTWFVLLIADLLCGFGERLWRIVPWIAVVAVAPAFFYAVLGGVNGSHGLLDDLRYSFNQLTDFTPRDLSASSHLVDFVGGVQRVLGVALLGLFGFVLGNKLRSS